MRVHDHEQGLLLKEQRALVMNGMGDRKVTRRRLHTTHPPILTVPLKHIPQTHPSSQCL